MMWTDANNIDNMDNDISRIISSDNDIIATTGWRLYSLDKCSMKLRLKVYYYEMIWITHFLSFHVRKIHVSQNWNS